MASSGPNYASACVNDSSIGTTAWTNPGNATTDNGSAATVSASLFGTTSSQGLKATGFGFSIPTGATIDGIVVEWKRQETGSSGVITDTDSRIVKGGTIGSTNKSSGTAWPTSAAYQSYGGASDLWGQTWTPADINSSGFGAALAASVESGAFGAVTASVDACRITVYYTPAPIQLAADLASESSVTANLSTAIKLAADLSSTSAASASLTTSIKLAADLASSATVTLDTRTVLRANLASESAVTAELSTAIKMAASLASESTVTADLSTAIKLACSMVSESSCSSSLTTTIKLAAGLASVSSAGGPLTTAIKMSAALASVSSIGADLVIRFPRYLEQTETIFLAEIEAYDPDTSSVITYRYSSGRGFDNSGIFYPPRIENPASFNREVSIDGTRADGSYGELTLVNVDGGCNALASDYCDGRRLTLKVGPQDGSYGAFQTILTATISDVTVERQRVSIRLKDAGAAFDKPFSTAQYAGTNVLPLGIEGTEDDIKGQYKPRVFGRVALMQPVLVNTSKLIYQVSNSAIDAIANVFDAGAYLARGSDYSSQSDMETNAPSPGYYRAWLAGGCFRVGSAAYGTISCSVVDKWTYSQISAGGIIQRIFSEIGFTDYVAGDFTALNAKTAAPLGILVEDGETIADLIDRICGTIGAYWGFDALNRFRIGRLDAPSSSVAVITDYHLIEIERQPRDISPAWKVSIDADANYAKQEKKSLAGVVTTVREAWLSAEYRTRKSEDAAVQTEHLLADEQKSESLFCSVSQAQAEATRRLNLHSSRRDTVTFSVPIQCPIFSSLDIGATVTLQTDMLGYSAGRNMIITMMAPDYRAGICQLTAWG